MSKPMKKFTDWDIYRKAQYLPIGRIGALLTASRERLRAHAIGSNPDPEKVGAPGDGVIGAAAIPEVLNEIFAPTWK